MGLAIIPASLEHRRGVQEVAVCSSYIALLVVGSGITFSTILAKTYRINRIMDSAKNFRRIKLSVRDTIYPVAINLVCTYNESIKSVQPICRDRFLFLFTCMKGYRFQIENALTVFSSLQLISLCLH